jgi:hypothetical protein
MKTIQYKIQNNPPPDNTPCAVTIVGQNISIPFDVHNSDYQRYLEWLAEGNAPLPSDGKI